jgi:Na+-translocating ferredoxin:NAD+ oxidoreductase RnfE subunit
MEELDQNNLFFRILLALFPWNTTKISITYTNSYCLPIPALIQRTCHEYHVTNVRFLLHFQQQIRFPISKHIVSPYFSMLFAILRAYLQICFPNPLIPTRTTLS